MLFLCKKAIKDHDLIIKNNQVQHKVKYFKTKRKRNYLVQHLVTNLIAVLN